MSEKGPDDKIIEPSKASKGGKEKFSLNFDMSERQRKFIDSHVGGEGEFLTAGEFIRDLLRRDMGREAEKIVDKELGETFLEWSDTKERG